MMINMIATQSESNGTFRLDQLKQCMN